jgi:hypothetical protein
MIELVFTSIEFLNRFTAAERSAFRTLATTDDNAADYLNLVTAATEVLNTDPEVVVGMDYLVAIGFLTRQRADEILGGQEAA